MSQILPSGSMITVIHFTYKVGNDYRLACMPNMTNLHVTVGGRPAYQRTNEKAAVTCPGCRKTHAYLSA